jgi:hypothetical protein
VEKAINSGTYMTNGCVDGPEPSSSNHEFIISGARAAPLLAEEASLVGIPSPAKLEPALAKGHRFGLMCT